MVTTILGIIVALFASKHIFAIGTRIVLGLIGRGVVATAKVGHDVGSAVDSGIAAGAVSRLSERVTNAVGSRGVFNKTPTSTAMEGFVVNTEDFGMVVFGSEDALITALADKTVEAIAEKLETPEGRKEVAERLAKVSQRKDSK